MNAPDLTVVITWHDRDEIAVSLAHNLPLLGAGVEVVLAASGDVEHLRTIVSRLAPPSGQVRILDVRGGVRDAGFVRARSCNAGVFVARGLQVLLLDADVLLDASTVTELQEAHHAGNVVTVARVRESESGPPPERVELASFARLVEFVDARGRRAVVATNRVHFDDGSRAGPGLVLLDRAHYLAVGGMDSSFLGWGWEDIDLLVRLQLVLGVEVVERASVVHLSHGDDRRSFTDGSPEESEARNFRSATARYLAGALIGTGEADVAALRSPGSSTSGAPDR